MGSWVMGHGRGGRDRLRPHWEFDFPLFRAAIYIAVVTASAIALAWPHLEMVRIGYEVARLQAERNILAQERRVLRVEIGSLRQLDRIESIARSKLGMVFPRPDQIVYVMVPARHL
jgi:cell division protein FtsL